MKSINKSIIFIVLAAILISCTPQAAVVESTPTQLQPTFTLIPPTVTSTSTSLPTETPLPTVVPSATPASCAVPLNPIDNAAVPAKGPFDFTWTAFAGAASYVISIGPENWYPTNFPITGTTLTRYMELFPASPSYQWSITAINAAGQEICKAGPYKFVTSAEVSATPSFNINVAASNDNNPSDNSSSGNQNVSNNGTNNGSDSGSSNNSFTEVLPMIVSDVDDAQCRLSASYRVKSNVPFNSVRLIYTANGQAGYVDMTLSGPLSPYPAYNYYFATTPPLPVKQGDIVNFGISFGEDTGGGALQHTMINCSQ